MTKKKAALLSVSNRDGLIEFAKGLQDLGYTILCTQGTGSYLSESGIETLAIEEYTAQKEILGGRVKTLHPKIHAGILARRKDLNEIDNPDLIQLEEEGILPIEVVAVNLYPFIEKLSEKQATNANITSSEMVEYVDIGGPTMIRAAAKNYQSVYAVIDPQDYSKVLNSIASSATSLANSIKFRQALAAKVFAQVANYNLEIARFFSADTESLAEGICNKIEGIVVEQQEELRYGENPHQKGQVYSELNASSSKQTWSQLQGKTLSYNNLLDFDAAASAVRSLAKLSQQPAIVIVKHLNPCGAAQADTLVKALDLAKKGDPRSHFGGIIAASTEIDLECALAISEDFTEIVVAPGFSKSALEVLEKKKNLRLIKLSSENQPKREIRSVAGQILIQDLDPVNDQVSIEQIKTDRKVTTQELADLQFAWTLCAYVKSNAIVIVKNQTLLASGAGQMSRIDSVEVALHKARVHEHDLQGAVVASDAFFPFFDCIEVLAAAGVKAIVAPAGAKRDDEVIQKANELGISLLHTEIRHFRH